MDEDEEYCCGGVVGGGKVGEDGLVVVLVYDLLEDGSMGLTACSEW